MKRVLLLLVLSAGIAVGMWGVFSADAPSTGVGTTVAPATNDWVAGSTEEKFGLVSKHLRGLDMAMVETDYRYSELFWAGKDRNWEYAAYQLDKIKYTLELGIERRPKRAASAQVFLTNAIPQMKQAIEKKDAAGFDLQFKLLTVACNTCHSVEKMAFVEVHPPEARSSTVRFKGK